MTNGELPADESAETRGAGFPYGKVALGVLALAALVALGRTAGDYVPAVARWVESLGVWGPTVFIGIYVAAVVAFVPASLLTLAAGAIFGVAAGTAYAFTAATIGSALAFLVSRYAARRAVARRVEGSERFAAIDRAVGEQGLKIVFLLRLSPVFPFNLLNYALGLTRVRFPHYLLASAGMLPGTFAYVYSGDVAGSVAAVAGGAESVPDTWIWVLRILGLVATIVVTAIVTRIARRALADATGVEE